MRKPFYKASHKAWYIHNSGKLVKLGKTEPEAMAAWAAMQGTPEPAAPQATGLTLAELVKEWLSWVGKHKSKATLQSYRKYANKWAGLHGTNPVANIRGFHVTRFCDDCYPVTDGYSDSVRWQAQKVAVVMFSWAKSEGLIDVNPLVGYRKSAKCGVREAFLTEADYLKLVTGCDDAGYRVVLSVKVDYWGLVGWSP